MQANPPPNRVTPPPSRLTQSGPCYLLSKKILLEDNTWGVEERPGNMWEETVSDLTKRIEQMHRKDITIAWAFVIGLWLSIGFVAWATWSLAPSGAARTLLLIGGATVLVFNTAAIMAMLRHYREDRDFMYGLDIKFLDAARAARGK